MFSGGESMRIPMFAVAIGLAMTLAGVALGQDSPINKFKYPGARTEASKPSNVVHYLKMATKDDLRTVVKYYEKVLGKDLEEFGTKGPIVRIGDDDLAMALDHSAGPDQKKRPVDIRIVVQQTKSYYLNVVVSRQKEEKETHIAVQLIQKR
jgi:hypothetical protein